MAASYSMGLCSNLTIMSQRLGHHRVKTQIIWLDDAVGKGFSKTLHIVP
jgi:hypothetical protein